MIAINHYRYTKRKFALFLFFLVLLSSSVLQADHSYYYYIDRDENGFFIQTENDGSYYLDTKFVRKSVTAGQKGQYSLVTDDHGTYLVTNRHGKFLIDSAAIDKGQGDVAVADKTTRIVINGDQILVPVTIGVKLKKVETFLLLDTGATTVALHLDLAKKLKIKVSKKSMVEVAGGKTIKAGVSVLNSIQVGPIEKKDISVCIIDSHPGSGGYQGLLGMNFLSNVNYRIDFKKQLIIWD